MAGAWSDVNTKMEGGTSREETRGQNKSSVDECPYVLIFNKGDKNDCAGEK
jgi:hypothetical protein